MAQQTGRAHTGRRRNEAARQAILDAALRLVARADGDAVTVDAIAAEAGVGKQTIYRWWRSKYAVLLEALAERAATDVPTPDTGSLRGDLVAYLTATFLGASRVAAALRALMADAQRDPQTAEMLGAYTASRRATLHTLLRRGIDRGELTADADLDLLADQAYGVLWYRLLLGHAPLSAAAATALADSLLVPAGSRWQPRGKE